MRNFRSSRGLGGGAVHADFQGQVALALGSDFALSFLHMGLKNGALSQGTPELQSKWCPGGWGEGRNCRAGWGIGHLCASQAAPVVITGSYQGVPGHLLPAVRQSGAPRSPDCGPMSPTAGSNSKLSKPYNDLECVYACLCCQHLMRRKYWSWFSFNNLIDLLKLTRPSNPGHHDSFLHTPAEYIQLKPLPSVLGPLAAAR